MDLLSPKLVGAAGEDNCEELIFTMETSSDLDSVVMAACPMPLPLNSPAEKFQLTF